MRDVALSTLVCISLLCSAQVQGKSSGSNPEPAQSAAPAKQPSQQTAPPVEPRGPSPQPIQPAAPANQQPGQQGASTNQTGDTNSRPQTVPNVEADQHQITVTTIDPPSVDTAAATRILLTGNNLDKISGISALPGRLRQNCDPTKAPCPQTVIQTQSSTALSLLVSTNAKTPTGNYILNITPQTGFTLDALAENASFGVAPPAPCSAFSPDNVISAGDVYCSASILGWGEARSAFGNGMSNNYIFVEVTITNLATDKDIFVVALHVNFKDRFNTDPRDADVVTEAAKRANTYASRTTLFRGMTFINGLIGGIATTSFAPDELQIANGQLSAFIPGLDKFWPDHTARELELFIEKTFNHTTAVVRRNNDTHTFEVPIEQRLFMTKEERKAFRKYKTGCLADVSPCVHPDVPLISNLQDMLDITVIGTAVRGVNEPAQQTNSSNQPNPQTNNSQPNPAGQQPNPQPNNPQPIVPSNEQQNQPNTPTPNPAGQQPNQANNPQPNTSSNAQPGSRQNIPKIARQITAVPLTAPIR